jgi:hypothetical protein
MRKDTKKYKTLKFLAQGKSQSWIVKNKSYNKSVVCRYTTFFIGKKWLICTTPNCHIKYYRATPKAPITTEEKCKQVDTKLHRGVYTRIENKRWKIKILSDIKRKISWDKSIKIKNGVEKKYLFFPQITIEKINDTIILYPLKQLLEDVELEKLDEVLFNEMSKVVAWLMKLLQCRCSFPPEEIEETEYAYPILNPEVQRVLKHCGVMIIGDCWIDCSKNGFVWGELESTDPEKLKTMRMLQWSDMDIPNRVSKCEQQLNVLINRIQSTLEKIELSFSPKNHDLDDNDLKAYG